MKAAFGALMLVMLLASLDQTIMSTALPTIVGEFGDLARLSWVVTAYILATTVVTPIYGKLGDLFGRKLVLQAGVSIFLIGSVLSGLSQSMSQLIIFRMVQGIGGGGLMVTTMATIGDLVSPRERGRAQGVFGVVYGLSTVAGPLIGGFIVEHLNWRWIFYINIPLGLVALFVIGWALPKKISRHRPVIDFAGAAMICAALTLIVLITSLAGGRLPWASPIILMMSIACFVAVVGFIAVERRAMEPLLPLSLFLDQTFSISAVVGFLVGMAMFGTVTYVPLYLQAAKGEPPSVAGLLLMPMMAGILASGLGSGFAITKFGVYRRFPVLGTAICSLSLLLMATLSLQSSSFLLSAYMLLLGIGMGMVMQVLVIAVQNAVHYQHLGTATAGMSLFRQVGASVGVSIFGALIARSLEGNTSSPSTLNPEGQLTAAGSAHSAVKMGYPEAYAHALHPVFVIAAVLAAIAFVLCLFLPEHELNDSQANDNLESKFGV